MTNSLALWRTVVRNILAFSPSCAISQTVRSANVKDLRASVRLFVESQRALYTHELEHRRSTREVVPRQMQKRFDFGHPMVAMTMVEGTSYVAFVDIRADVHLADLSTGDVVCTWKHDHRLGIERAIGRVGKLSLWESPSHGLVLMVHIWVVR
jgi:hypothetical protein